MSKLLFLGFDMSGQFANVDCRNIVAGMDKAEMEESFEGSSEDGYHPFKSGGLLGLA